MIAVTLTEHRFGSVSPRLLFSAELRGAIGSLTALWYRLNTGEGQFVDVSMQESACSVQHECSTDVGREQS